MQLYFIDMCTYTWVYHLWKSKCETICDYEAKGPPYLLTPPLSHTHPGLLTSFGPLLFTTTLYTEEDCVLFLFSHLTMKDTKAWKAAWIFHDCKAERLNKEPNPGPCIANTEFFLLQHLTSPLPKCLLSPNGEKWLWFPFLDKCK